MSQFSAARLVRAVATFVLAAGTGLAQSTLANVVGVVQDQSQSVVAGAAIQLRNLEDNSTRQTVSVADGSFQFPNLKAGKYSVSIQKDGFSQFVLPSLEVDARQTARVEATLSVASAASAIEVNEAAAVINTDNATLGDTKKFNQVVQLPMNYRGGNDSPLAALVAVPGAQQDANGQISLGGGLPSQIQYSVDGSSTVNVRQNGALGNMNPSSELIAEFKVTQFNNNAEFSQPGDVTIITKSGTNHLHGSGFEYLQNSALDATVYGFDTKAHKAYNTFGGSLSGPVVLPRLYHGTDKTFFFADFEGNRRRFATPQQFSVPTAAMRAGDLNGLPGAEVTDPLTGAAFPGNRIPDSRLNATAQSLFANYLPLPNFGDGIDTNANFRRQQPTPASINGYDIRIDQVLNSKQQIFGRWSWKNVDTTVANAILPSDSDKETNRNLIVSHNYTIRPTLLNELRFGMTRYALQVGFPIAGADAVRTLGLVGLDLGDVPGVNAFPGFNFSDGTGFTAFNRDKTGVTRSQTAQVADNLSWIKGSHTMKFGADFRRVYYYDLESFGGSNDFGYFTFNAGTFTGNAFGDLLLGLPAKAYVAQSGPDVRARAYQTGLYAQDEWRASRSLTVTFGLRWQALQPFVSEIGNLTAFDKRNGGVIVPDNATVRPAFLETINGCPGINPGLPCAPVTRASDVGLGGGVREFYKKNFQPRVGLAWRPFHDNRTVFRAGFGIFTMTSLGQLSFNTTNIAVAAVRTTANGLSAAGLPLYQFPNVGASADPLAIAGTGDFYQNVDTRFRDPQSAQWNITIERQLAADLTLRVSYAGMNSYRMPQTEDLNQQRASAQPNDFGARPYPNWGRILSSENDAFVNYQSLQTEVNKSLSHGLLFQASHTWAKNLSNVGGDAPTLFSPEVIYGTAVADRFNLALNRGNVAGARRQRFLVSAIYQLPFGKGRTFLRSMKPVANGILGGWELSSVTMLQTGPFLTPITSPTYDSANLNLVYRGSYLRPDRVASGSLPHPTPDQYFDLGAFQPVPGAGRIGNSGVGILQGPGTVAIAAGLAKTFTLWEGGRLRFEATFTNLPNHPNFAPPSVDVSSPATFGKITSVQSAENSGNRTGQVALRIDF